MQFQAFKTVESATNTILSSFFCRVDNAPSDVQLELFDLQSDSALAEHFIKSVSELRGCGFSVDLYLPL